jgi:hypothetical protein
MAGTEPKEASHSARQEEVRKEACAEEGVCPRADPRARPKGQGRAEAEEERRR